MRITITNQPELELSIHPQQDSLLDILKEHHIYIDAPCNGNGKCGKCRLTVQGTCSEITETEKKLLSNEELAAGVRLACMTRPMGDCQLTLPANGGYTVQTTGETGNFEVNSRVGKGVGMAVDIGTTTVACYFYDLTSGKLLYTASGLNEQRSFGADVISRIESTSADANGKKLLQKAILSQLNRMIDEFCSETGKTPANLTDVFIAGNTVMLHLLCGLDASGIAVAPFTPTSLFGADISACELGLTTAADAKVYLADSIASYVGGDITAGLLACDADKLEKPCIYIDIGTNGEMALGDKNGFTCCATAAGPAFEGAHIKYGVGGISGAISKVWIENGTLRTETINGAKPVGICGSGLVDAIACLLTLNIIDETGRMDEDEIPDEYVDLYQNDEFLLDRESGIALTQKDIREVQLAKAAIAAGINTLLDKRGLSITDVDKVIVAGGFGSFIDKASACTIGLLPREKLDRTAAVGNAAGMGAIKALLSQGELARLKKVTGLCNYFELSGDPFFQDDYVEQMMF